MESVFVIGLGCVAWTAIEVFRLSSTSATIAMPAATRPLGTAQQTGAGRSPQSTPSAERAARTPRFAAWDDRGRPVSVEDLGRA